LKSNPNKTYSESNLTANKEYGNFSNPPQQNNQNNIKTGDTYEEKGRYNFRPSTEKRFYRNLVDKDMNMSATNNEERPSTSSKYNFTKQDDIFSKGNDLKNKIDSMRNEINNTLKNDFGKSKEELPESKGSKVSLTSKGNAKDYSNKSFK